GASAGMGREISLQLARSGAIVVMVCRDAGRGAVALDTVRSGSGNDTVELMLADLSSQRSIRALAHDFIRTHDRLDVLVNNAGVTANAVEPGFVKTSMKVPFPYSLFSFMRQPVEKGAWISVHAATSPALDGVNGAFLSNRGIQIRSSKASYDEGAQERLWQIS